MCKCYTVLFIFMPSNRKRIGFLPSEEVHHLIEKICIENNCSQSKVTGILVEEALRIRGDLDPNINNYKKTIGNTTSSDNFNNFDIKNNLNKDFTYSYKNNKNFNDELEMIKEYIDFKFFKKVMIQNNEILN